VSHDLQLTFSINNIDLLEGGSNSSFLKRGVTMNGLNLKVADVEMRGIVEDLKKKGLPPAVRIEDAMPTLTPEQKRILSQFSGLAHREKRVSKNKKKPVKGDNWYKVREDIRKIIQSAIKSGLINLEVIQKRAVMYGAIPDPKDDWRYYVLPDGTYACWRCGAEISLKTVFLSVHIEGMPLVGTGEVRQKQVPYCPKCEKEPSERGIITENLANETKIDSPWPIKASQELSR
jgi:hypothetical protein